MGAVNRANRRLSNHRLRGIRGEGRIGEDRIGSARRERRRRIALTTLLVLHRVRFGFGFDAREINVALPLLLRLALEAPFARAQLLRVARPKLLSFALVDEVLCLFLARLRSRRCGGAR